jgi:hypothetical protein
VRRRGTRVLTPRAVAARNRGAVVAGRGGGRQPRRRGAQHPQAVAAPVADALPPARARPQGPPARAGRGSRRARHRSRRRALRVRAA